MWWNAYKTNKKGHFTFSNTLIFQDDIDKIIKRYNSANFIERQVIRQEPLFKKLIEKKIIVFADDCIRDDFGLSLQERTKQIDDNISKTKNQINNTYTFEQLENDTVGSLDKYAREQLNLQKPNEDVFKVVYEWENIIFSVINKKLYFRTWINE